MLLKRSSFLGCSFVPSPIYESLIQELSTLLHKTRLTSPSESRSQQINLLIINCLSILCFSFNRKLLLPADFITDLIQLKPTISVSYASLPYQLRYSCIDVLELFLSSNR